MILQEFSISKIIVQYRNQLSLIFVIGTQNFMTDYRIHISSDPTTMLGKPCIKGTRIPVALILKKLSEDFSIEDLLESYPTLSKEKILACTAYAADMMSNEALLTA